MTNDPKLDAILARKVKAWKAAGATPDELAELVAEFDQQHRFADPNAPADVQGVRERIVAGPEFGGRGDPQRRAEGGEGSFEAMLGAVNPLQDEMSGAVAALIPGGKGYSEARDASRNRQAAFRQDNPGWAKVQTGLGMAAPALATGGGVLAARAATNAGRIAPQITGMAKTPILKMMGAGAKSGAGWGGGYAFGAAEGNPENQALMTLLGTGGGAALGAVAPAVGRVVSKAPRVLGITTKGGRNREASRQIASAIERSGQLPEDVVVRANKLATERGAAPSVAEALGDDASEIALEQMGALRDASAGLANRAAAEAGESRIGQAYHGAASKRHALGGIPNPTFLRGGLISRGLTLGTRHAKTRESETLLDLLRSKADVGDVTPLTPVRPTGPTPKPTTASAPAVVKPGLVNPSRHSAQWLDRRRELQGIKLPRQDPTDADLEALARHLLSDPAAKVEYQNAGGLEDLLRVMVKKGEITPRVPRSASAKRPDMEFLRRIWGIREKPFIPERP